MLDNHFHFLRDIVVMQAYPLIELNLGFLGINLFVGRLDRKSVV